MDIVKQSHIAKLHVNENSRRLRKLREAKNPDNVPVCVVHAQFSDGTKLVLYYNITEIIDIYNLPSNAGGRIRRTHSAARVRELKCE